MGYQSFPKGYTEQIVRVELDSVLVSNKIREIFQHHEQGEMNFAKELLPGNTRNYFPQYFASLSFMHKTGWKSPV